MTVATKEIASIIDSALEGVDVISCSKMGESYWFLINPEMGLTAKFEKRDYLEYPKHVAELKNVVDFLQKLLEVM